MILGFDPGRDKCGISLVGSDRSVHFHDVAISAAAIAQIADLRHRYPIHTLVMGNQTTAQQWKARLTDELNPPLPIILIDERYSTLEARDRYWQMYPPKGLTRLIPQGMREIPRPIDDLVAILLVERYLDRKAELSVNPDLN
ncbi:MAG: resolvase [Thermosynechococcaceae cyanobacterium]